MTTLADQRILLVGINYAPEHTGIAPYTTQACEYFVAEGAEVLVLAGTPHYPHWSTPPKYRRRLRVDEVQGTVRVRRLRHVVPSKQTAVTRAAYEVSFGLHVLAERLPWKPTIVVAVVPSLLGAAAAGIIARRTGARSVVWVQDLMGPATEQSGIAGGSQITMATGALEGQVLRRADAVLVLNDAFRRYVEGLGVPPRRVVQQPNWTHLEGSPGKRREQVRRRLGWGEDEVVVLHSGNMGLKQGLENVVEAARLAASGAPSVRFVLMGDGSQREALQRSGAGVSKLSFLPPASREDFLDVLAAADVLLVNELPSALDMSLPSKLTSYFRAGRPVLAAVPEDGGTAAEVRRSGAGHVVPAGDPHALLTGVVRVTADAAAARAMAKAATAYDEQYLGAAAALNRLAQAVGATRRSTTTSA